MVRTLVPLVLLLCHEGSGAGAFAAPFAAGVASRLPPINRRGAASPGSTVSLNAVSLKMSGGETTEVGGGTATMSSEIFNLVKNICGAGVLALPAGIAAFGDAPSALLPAAAMIGSLGLLSAYSFSLIGRVCAMTGAASYRDCWDKTVGRSTSWLPAASTTFKTGVANLAYSMILADTFKSLFAAAGYNFSRSNVLFGITGSVLLPLCLLKNLASLAPFSLLGIIGMGFTTASMGIRYLDGSYKAGGKFVAELAPNLTPAFGTKGAAAVMNPNSFILVCMLSTAYLAHYNAPKYFNELKDNTVKRFNTVVATSFAVSSLTFIGVASLGFLTFGSNSAGLILNNYATGDALASLSRIAVALSIVFSYPLTFVGIRDGLLDLASVPEEKRTNPLLDKLSVIILAAVTGLALKVKDLSFVLSFGGATLGNAIIFVYPVCMFVKAVRDLGDKASASLKKEVPLAISIAATGIGLGIIGTKMALKSL
eukprot:CAMPEP_0194275196 /NCGR_PEP_ID=MMETSP0169-20130528/8099_1 /TAXON_ID=218684 /ORGANISM="Corethron pennatum, Strain L29A3" /LENGTH=481 /DNA_ID=CAMNT_0039018605 /DNA_START=69 /DNA_END=1514 /DNA_ORIENTATION=-